MLRLRVAQCLCTQCEGELLHLYEVCLLVIAVEHISQVQVWVVGPGFVSTSPDRARSPASHMRGSMGRHTEKTVELGPSLEWQGLVGADLVVLFVPFFGRVFQPRRGRHRFGSSDIHHLPDHLTSIQSVDSFAEADYSVLFRSREFSSQLRRVETRSDA